ncbi:hypothetical protein N9595_00990 [Bacteroidia bacterium]|nr:hypothetical protein [Bacteroidia bacterium]
MKSSYLKQHLTKCDLSFLPFVKSEITELKNQIEAEDAILRNVVPEDWSDDIAELEKRFNSIELPNESIKINECCIVNDCSLFIDSHLTVVKANNGKDKFKPYLQRLQNLAEITRGG